MVPMTRFSTSDQVYLQCSNPNCAFRFPAPARAVGQLKCPRCGSGLLSVPWQGEVHSRHSGSNEDPGQHVEALLDNIRSTFNLGAMFRTADGAGIAHLYLCGITPHPENPKVSKTALGAEYAIPWTYSPNGYHTAVHLVESGKTLWALETGGDSISIFDAIREAPPTQPVVLVTGNEVAGIDPGIQSLCECSVFIPMKGFKRSLNVAIAFGVAAYLLRYGFSIFNPIDLKTRNE